jgi:hypothetical protein
MQHSRRSGCCECQQGTNLRTRKVIQVKKWGKDVIKKRKRTVSAGRMNVVALGPKFEKKNVMPYTNISAEPAIFSHWTDNTK